MLAVALLAVPVHGALLWWPVSELNDYTNPAGPDFKPYFLTNGGSRMVFIRPDGAMVIPMEELGARAYQAQLMYNPPTVNPLMVVGSGGSTPAVPVPEPTPAPTTQSGTGNGPGTTGGSGNTGGTSTTVTNSPAAQPAAVAIPEPGTMAMMGLGLMGMAFAMRRRFDG